MTVSSGSSQPSSPVRSSSLSPKKGGGGGGIFRGGGILRSPKVDPHQAIVDGVDEIEIVEEVVVEPGSPSSSRRGSPGRSPLRRSNSMGAGLLSSRSDEIVEFVLDDDTEVELDDDDDEELIDDSEYYEDIELADEDEYEEIVYEEDDPADNSAASAAHREAKPPPAAVTAPPPPEHGEICLSVRVDPSALVGKEEKTPEEDDDTEDDEDGEDLPDRDDVIEAINYILKQEQVVQYGLVSQAQVDEMNALSLPELMEIMHHFEACENNNATIRWDLVLALVNPKYATNLDDDPSSDDEDEVADKVADLGPRGRTGPLFKPDDGSCSVHSDAVEQDHASVGSGYSLDANRLDCDSSISANDDDDEGDGHGIVEDSNPDLNQSSKSNLDPRIRAQYTRSMVELTRKNS